MSGSIKSMIASINRATPKLQAGAPAPKTGGMKSYQRLNTRLDPASVQVVARVAEKLESMGFTIITGQFGNRPSITVRPTAATLQLASVCTGQGGAAGQMYRSYAAKFEGVPVIWHKPMRPFAVS
jgi:hypothetical protein